MSVLQDRAANLIARYGEDFTVGEATHRGVFTNMTTSTARAYLTAGEIDAASLPLWACLVSQDNPVAVGNILSWNSLTLTVKKIAQARFQGGLVAKMLILTS